MHQQMAVTAAPRTMDWPMIFRVCQLYPCQCVNGEHLPSENILTNAIKIAAGCALRCCMLTFNKLNKPFYRLESLSTSSRPSGRFAAQSAWLPVNSAKISLTSSLHKLVHACHAPAQKSFYAARYWMAQPIFFWVWKKAYMSDDANHISNAKDI